MRGGRRVSDQTEKKIHRFGIRYALALILAMADEVCREVEMYV